LRLHSFILASHSGCILIISHPICAKKKPRFIFAQSASVPVYLWCVRCSRAHSIILFWPDNVWNMHNNTLNCHLALKLRWEKNRWLPVKVPIAERIPEIWIWSLENKVMTRVSELISILKKIIYLFEKFINVSLSLWTRCSIISYIRSSIVPENTNYLWKSCFSQWKHAFFISINY
jgi:hypothetical protein